MSVTSNSLVLNRAVKIAKAENSELFEGLPEDLVESYAYRIGQRILNETNRPDIPQALTYTIADMLVDLITLDMRDSSEDEDSSKEIKSIKEGDVTVTYVDERSKTPYRSGSRSMQSVLFNYSKQISQFRKMAW